MAYTKLMSKDEMLDYVSDIAGKRLNGNCESYGRETRLYIHCGTKDMKDMVQSFLRLDGHTVYRYGIDTVVEVKIKYNNKAFGAGK